MACQKVWKQDTDDIKVEVSVQSPSCTKEEYAFANHVCNYNIICVANPLYMMIEHSASFVSSLFSYFQHANTEGKVWVISSLALDVSGISQKEDTRCVAQQGSQSPFRWTAWKPECLSSLQITYVRSLVPRISLHSVNRHVCNEQSTNHISLIKQA